MPIDSLAEGIFGSVFRFIGWVCIDVIFEMLVKGAGYLVCRPFKKVDPDGLAAFVFGVLFWVFLGFCIYIVCNFIFVNLEIDSCLDSGGRFDYKLSACVY